MCLSLVMLASYVYKTVLSHWSQDGQSPDTIALSDLKAALKDIAPKLVSAGGHKQVPFCTTSYLISCDLSTGLQWGKMTAEQAFLQSSYLHTGEIETLTIEVLKKVHYAIACMSWLEIHPCTCDSPSTLSQNIAKRYFEVSWRSFLNIFPPLLQNSPSQSSPCSNPLSLQWNSTAMAMN